MTLPKIMVGAPSLFPGGGGYIVGTRITYTGAKPTGDARGLIRLLMCSVYHYQCIGAAGVCMYVGSVIAKHNGIARYY